MIAFFVVLFSKIMIFFVDALAEQLTCVVGPDEEGWTIPLGRGIAGYVALTGDLVNVDDVYKYGKFDPQFDVRGSYKPKSVLSMGIKNNENEVIAVLYAVNKRSAARQAHLQWNGATVNSTGNPTLNREVSGSPLRPQGPPPASHSSHHHQQQTPPAGLNPYSSALPPPSGAAPLLKKTGSRSSMVGSASPWHSLRPSSSAGLDASNHDMGRVSPMSSLPSPARPHLNHRGSLSDDSPIGRESAHERHTQHLNMMSSQSSTSSASDSESVEAFVNEDEEILRALCAEVKSLLIRHVRETVLEMNQLSMNESVYSLMDSYTGTFSGRNAVSVAAAHAVNQIHQTTSGLAGPPVQRGAAKPGLMRPSTLTKKRAAFKGAQPSEHISWPISTSKFSDLLTMEFNVWCYSPDDLLVFSYAMFEEMRLIDEFQIIPETLKSFLLTVRQNYHDNPFHNWYHGFSVLHFSYLALRLLTNASEYLTQHDVLALMIGSLCHDIDHPGNTNSFEINTSSELALIHNDLSVLEVSSMKHSTQPSV